MINHPAASEERQHVRSSTSGREVVAVWLLWAGLLAMIAVTYSRLDPADLYHVSGRGVAGGLSRVLLELDFPVSLVAIALVLVALAALPRRAQWVGAPAIVLCAVTALPNVVDEADLDARPINVVPALGVLLALVLSVAALRTTADHFAPRRRFDAFRVGIAVLVIVVSIPWLAAELGFFLPDGVFVMQRPLIGADGAVEPIVHLGHHHGLDGALIVISALLLSRLSRHVGRLGTATRWYVSLLLAYGLVNLVEDGWNEQIAARGWVQWQMPSGQVPGLTVMWLVIAVLTGLAAMALRREDLSPPSP